MADLGGSDPPENPSMKIWPDVGALMTATGGAFRFYADQLRPYLGRVPIFSR